MVRQEPLETGHNVGFSHVNVIALCDPRRTVPHKPGEREFIHPAFRAAGAEGMPPAVKLKGL
jgi:hypothetical protein